MSRASSRSAASTVRAGSDTAGSGDDATRDAQPNRIAELYGRRGPFPILLNGRHGSEWRRHFPALRAAGVASPSHQVP